MTCRHTAEPHHAGQRHGTTQGPVAQASSRRTRTWEQGTAWVPAVAPKGGGCSSELSAGSWELLLGLVTAQNDPFRRVPRASDSLDVAGFARESKEEGTLPSPGPGQEGRKGLCQVIAGHLGGLSPEGPACTPSWPRGSGSQALWHICKRKRWPGAQPARPASERALLRRGRDCHRLIPSGAV